MEATPEPVTPSPAPVDEIKAAHRAADPRTRAEKKLDQKMRDKAEAVAFSREAIQAANNAISLLAMFIQGQVKATALQGTPGSILVIHMPSKEAEIPRATLESIGRVLSMSVTTVGPGTAFNVVDVPVDDLKELLRRKQAAQNTAQPPQPRDPNWAPKVGDVVKTGKAQKVMTVMALDTAKEGVARAICYWMNDANQRCEKIFLVSDLVPADNGVTSSPP